MLDSRPLNLVNINSIHIQTLGTCGYCASHKHPTSHWMTSGFDCNLMQIEQYQELLDRGFRRCGNYYYRPHSETSCCRLYPIRLNVKQFKEGHNRTKVMKKFERFLNF